MIHLSEQNGGVFQNVDKVVEKVRSRTPMGGKAAVVVAAAVTTTAKGPSRKGCAAIRTT